MKTIKFSDKELNLLYEVLDNSIDDAYNVMTDDPESTAEINAYVEKLKVLISKLGFKYL